MEDYYDKAPSGPAQCVSCGVGMNCAGRVGLTLQTLPIAVGYYRTTNNTDDVQQCPDASTGCRGESNCEASINSSRSGCIGGDSGNLCRDGLTGIYCRLCSQPAHHYVPAMDGETAHCNECGDSIGRSTGVIFGGVGVLLLLLSGAYLVRLLLVKYHRKEFDKYYVELERRSKLYRLGTKCKIIIA